MAKYFIFFILILNSYAYSSEKSKTDKIVAEYFNRFNQRLEKGSPAPGKPQEIKIESPKIDIPKVEELPTELKLTLGTFNSRKVDKLSAFSFALEYLGHFSQNRYTFKNLFEYQKFSMTDYYTQKNASYEEQHFQSKLMANHATVHLSFFTLFDFLKATQSGKRATNIEFNFGFIGAEYDFFPIPGKKWEKVSLGFIPIYQFLNVDKLDSNNEYIDKNSNEYLLYTFFFKFNYRTKTYYVVSNELSYAFLKDMKKGEYQMQNNVTKNRFEINFEATANITFFYRNDYISDKKREKFYNLPASDMIQSFNFAYTW